MAETIRGFIEAGDDIETVVSVKQKVTVSSLSAISWTNCSATDGIYCKVYPAGKKQIGDVNVSETSHHHRLGPGGFQALPYAGAWDVFLFAPVGVNTILRGLKG